jgi:ADP-heptose:LPS heptosyltransferase
VNKKILIIKLAAIGDVLRTTSILSGLKRRYPDSHITWLVSKEASFLLENNPKIDRILAYDLDSVLRLLAERFDLLLSFDKAQSAATLATLVKAGQKKGFALHERGYLYPLNKESEYAFRLGIDDKLKFKQNKKTYQELIYEMSGLDYKGDEYGLTLCEEARKYAADFLKKNKIKKGETVIGLNTGCGEVFATKKWTVEGFIRLARMLKNKAPARILLLGGPNELKRNKEIKSRLKAAVIDTGCNNSLKEFMGIIDCCALVVSSDTLAMQIAIALRKKVVALFGPTCHQEVDLYGRGEKIVSDLSCAPCYRQSCGNTKCMLSISPEEVFLAIKQQINK